MRFAYFRIISHIFSHILAPCLFVNCTVYATAYLGATVFLPVPVPAHIHGLEQVRDVEDL